MNYLYGSIFLVTILGLVLFLAYDKGRDDQNQVCLGRVYQQTEVNIEVEKVQNEIRSRPLSDDDFIGVLRRGQFGK